MPAPMARIPDPDEYRMSFGEHLDELRRRLIWAMAGLAIAFFICLAFANSVVAAFCMPLLVVLLENDISPQLYYTQVADPFLIFIKISLITALALASPWILIQVWLFVAAGLYLHERKYITRFLPLSLALLVGGMLFVYYFVLPLTLEFFVRFQIPLPPAFEVMSDQLVVTTQPSTIPALAGDPADPVENQIWINTLQGRVKLFVGGRPRVLPFGPETLTAPLITLPAYIDLVVAMLLVFGLCFQLPLAVLALVRVGLVEIEALQSGRRYVYFAMVVLAAIITPGDIITATVAMIVPLILLYELGIWLARIGEPANADR